MLVFYHIYSVLFLLPFLSFYVTDITKAWLLFSPLFVSKSNHYLEVSGCHYHAWFCTFMTYISKQYVLCLALYSCILQKWLHNTCNPFATCFCFYPKLWFWDLFIFLHRSLVLLFVFLLCYSTKWINSILFIYLFIYQRAIRLSPLQHNDKLYYDEHMSPCVHMWELLWTT